MRMKSSLASSLRLQLPRTRSERLSSSHRKKRHLSDSNTRGQSPTAGSYE